MTHNATMHAMSALGQKRTLGLVKVMSALPPKADIGQRLSHVRFVPIADIARMFDMTRKPPTKEAYADMATL
jgi:hypothetical protein